MEHMRHDLAETICLSKARSAKGAFSACPKQYLLPYATITHLPIIKALQTAKITKWAFYLSPLVFNRKLTISEMKSKFIFSPPGKRTPITEMEL